MSVVRGNLYHIVEISTSFILKHVSNIILMRICVLRHSGSNVCHQCNPIRAVCASSDNRMVVTADAGAESMGMRFDRANTWSFVSVLSVRMLRFMKTYHACTFWVSFLWVCDS